MPDKDMNAIRYMALRAAMLKLCERLENDIDHYDHLPNCGDEVSDAYEAGKTDEMRKVDAYLREKLEEAEMCGKAGKSK